MSDLITLSNLKDRLDIDHSNDDSRLNTLIAVVSGWVQKWTGRSFLNETRTEYLDGGEETLEVTNTPIVSVTHIKDDFESNPSAKDSDNYQVHNDSGLIYLRSKSGSAPLLGGSGGVASGVWGEGDYRWEVKYEGGFGQNTEDVPDDIKNAVKQICARLYDSPDFTINKEKLGDRDVGRGIVGEIAPVARMTLIEYDNRSEVF